MRRMLALVSAIVLAATLAGSAAAAPAVAKSSSFVGNFAMSEMSDSPGPVVGWANVEIRAQTDQKIVPGSYDFRGAKDYPIREAHAVLGLTEFWFDSGHGADSYVAYTEGVECLFTNPYVQDCHAFSAMFVDVLDPAARDWVEFQRHDPNDSSQDPTKPATWTRSQFFVEKGSFVLHCVRSSCPTNP